MDSLEIPLKYDLRNKNYNWLLNNFSDSFNKKIIVYQDTVKDLCLGDYSVLSNALHFFEDIHSELVDTVFNNIKYAQPDASDKEIFNAAKLSMSEEFINNLENGYETKIGENGV